jgi:hypothetical protein
MALAHGGLLPLRVVLLEVILARATEIELKRLHGRFTYTAQSRLGPAEHRVRVSGPTKISNPARYLAHRDPV